MATNLVVLGDMIKNVLFVVVCAKQFLIPNKCIANLHQQKIDIQWKLFLFYIESGINKILECIISSS